MVARLDNLPDEPERLKVLVREQQGEIARLQEYVNVLLAKRYGPSSEKVADEQLRLFNEAEQEAAAPEPQAPIPGPGPRASQARAPSATRMPAAGRGGT